jgi:hypothetical protein
MFALLWGVLCFPNKLPPLRIGHPITVHIVCCPSMLLLLLLLLLLPQIFTPSSALTSQNSL